MNKFRLLRADEIEVRAGKVSKDDKGKVTGFQLLLYKDARVDQRLLDETVGPLNWQKHYSRDNANCTVSIWDEEKHQWIDKEDTGTESNTEEEKGLASDSFKRACFCWGIGRSLYTTPFIWIVNGDPKKDRFQVTKIGYDEADNINLLEIINSKTKGVVFSYPDANRAITSKPQRKNEAYEAPKAAEPKKPIKVDETDLKARVIAYVNKNKFSDEDIAKLCRVYKVSNLNELSTESCNNYINFITKQGGQI